MDTQTRIAMIRREVNNIAANVELSEAQARTTLEAVANLAKDALKGLKDVRAAEEKRREDYAKTKQIHADHLERAKATVAGVERPARAAVARHDHHAPGAVTAQAV